MKSFNFKILWAVFVPAFVLVLGLIARANPTDQILTILDSNLTLNIGDQSSLTIESTSPGEDLEWISSDSNIVSVVNGQVTALNPGIVTIIVRDLNGPLFDGVNVTVIEDLVIKEPAEEESILEEPQVDEEPVIDDSDDGEPAIDEPEDEDDDSVVEDPEEEDPEDDPVVETPLDDEDEEETVTSPSIYTITIINETGAVITTLKVEEGSFITTSSLELPDNFKGFFFEGETCTDDPFDLETPITENLTLIQASINDKAPCLQLDFIVLSGRPVAGSTLSVDVFPLGANVTISWYTSVNNRTYREIPGESGSTFMVRPEDSGKFIRVYVVSDSNPPVVRYDTIKLDVFGTVDSGGSGSGQSEETLEERTQRLINEGFIPINSTEAFIAIGSDQDTTFTARVEGETISRFVTASALLGQKYILVDNIDLSGTTFTQSAINGIFTGTLIGQGFTISGLAIDTNETWIGLFSQLGTNATIENLTLSAFNITGGANVGALAGKIDSSSNISIQNIHLNNIEMKVTQYSGGLIGQVINSTNITITGIHLTTVKITESDSIGGIIGRVYANSTVTIMDVTSRDLILSGKSDIGGIIGYISSHSSVDISLINQAVNIESKSISTDSNTGGIVGIIRGEASVTLNQVVNQGYVTGDRVHVGGLIGRVGFQKATLTIKNAYNLATVEGSNDVGGLIGQIEDDATNVTIIHSYNAGNVTASASSPSIGSIIGQIENSPTVTLTSIYYLTGTALDNVSIGAIGSATVSGHASPVSIAQMTSLSTFDGWDIEKDSHNNNKIWTIQYNGQTTYPWLTFMGEPEPSQIIAVIPVHTGTDLKTIEDNLFGSFKLENDIDLASFSVLNQSFINDTFSGNLSGQGFTISNLKIDASNVSDVGLFVELGTNATIENLTLSAFNITGGNYVGALAGVILNPHISVNHIHLNGQIVGNDGVGGLIGEILQDNVVLQNITYNVTVMGIQSVGGLVGQIEGKVTISHINGESINIDGSENYIGGVVGAIASEFSDVTLSHIVASGSVQGPSIIGGMIGGAIDKAVIEINNVTLSAIHVTGSGNEVGGLIGTIFGASTLTGTGITIDNTNITGSSELGHVIGRIRSEGTPTVNLTSIDIINIPSPLSLKLVGLVGTTHTLHPSDEISSNQTGASITKP